MITGCKAVSSGFTPAARPRVPSSANETKTQAATRVHRAKLTFLPRAESAYETMKFPPQGCRSKDIITDANDWTRGMHSRPERRRELERGPLASLKRL